MSQKKKVIHEGNAANKDMIVMTLPLLVMGVFFYGPRVIALALAAALTAKIADKFAAMLRGRRYDATENSSITTALIITLLMPATVRFEVLIIAVLAGVLVGKAAFGGYGCYPFNPAAVGYCIVAVSWPEEIFRYPQPQSWLINTQWTAENLWKVWSLADAPLTDGPSFVLKNGGLPQINTWNLLLGNYVGPLGVTACLVILACAVYLVLKKRLPLGAPVTFLLTAAVLVFLLPRAPEGAWMISILDNPMQRLQAVKYEMLSSAFIFSAVFLISDPCTLPKNKTSQCVYGFLIGISTIVFRYFGTYELGVCFSLLVVNSVSGYFDRMVANIQARRTAKKANRRKGARQP